MRRSGRRQRIECCPALGLELGAFLIHAGRQLVFGREQPAKVELAVELESELEPAGQQAREGGDPGTAAAEGPEMRDVGRIPEPAEAHQERCRLEAGESVAARTGSPCAPSDARQPDTYRQPSKIKKPKPRGKVKGRKRGGAKRTSPGGWLPNYSPITVGQLVWQLAVRKKRER